MTTFVNYRKEVIFIKRLHFMYQNILNNIEFVPSWVTGNLKWDGIGYYTFFILSR